MKCTDKNDDNDDNDDNNNNNSNKDNNNNIKNNDDNNLHQYQQRKHWLKPHPQLPELQQPLHNQKQVELN